MKKENIHKLLIILVAACIRLPYLNSLPPGVQNAFWQRLPTALFSLISIFLFIALVNKITNSQKLSLISGAVLTLMPWHIEQSRMYSEAMMGLTVLLGGTYAFFYLKQKYLKIGVMALTSVGFYFLYPTFWIFSPKVVLPTWYFYLANLFKLVSFEFLFFKNDSFWLVGLRSVGVFLPTTIFIFLVGLYVSAKKLSSEKVWYYLAFLIILLIAAANPLFPEEREFFLAVPFLAYIMALGIDQLANWFKKKIKLVQILILFYFAFVVYDYLVLVHFYTLHYPLRIQQEIQYDKRTF